MKNVISLTTYRCKSRKLYLARYGTRIEHFIERFVATHIDINFQEITRGYQLARHGNSETSWNYADFREILGEAIEKVFGGILYQQLMQQSWFDKKLITREEINERCLSTYIMGQCYHATSSI